MTSREYAINLVSALSDEQVEMLVGFITGFSDSGTADRIKKAEFAANPINKSKLQSIERLRQMIRCVQIENEKEMLAEYREEKYGR